MSRKKLSITNNLHTALKAAVAEVVPIRERIRTTHDMDRWRAWADKRAGSGHRRCLHLALCYMRGTPYRKAEEKTCYDDPNLPDRARKALVSRLVRDIAGALVQYGCIPEGTTDDAVVKDVGVWVGGDTTALPITIRPGQRNTSKLYVIVRSDLPPGAQAVQGAHAMREFAAKYPDIERGWNETSNTLVMLASGSETSLNWILRCAREARAEVAEFREPDLNNSLTAICIGPRGYRLLPNLRLLPLALKEQAA